MVAATPRLLLASREALRTVNTVMDDSRTIEQAAAAWLARRDTGPWKPRDQQALEAWLAARTEHRVALLRLQAAWAETGRLKALAAGLPEGTVPERGHWSAWADGHAHDRPERPADSALNPPDLSGVVFAPRPAPAHARKRWPGMVAALFIMAATGTLGWWSQQAGDAHESTYASAMGEVLTLDLADGSRAMLSSDSQLEVRMDARQRHVELTRGEAFFEVAHDTRRPFVVEAGGHRAIALGTRYAVRHDADALRVVVTQGRVRLESAPGPNGQVPPVALLPAGSLASIDQRGVLVRSLAPEAAQRYLEWREGFLVFDDSPLSQAADEFNRFNARRLELADPGLAQLRVGGNFRWSNLDGFVGLLEQGFPVRAERHPDRIILHSH